MKASMTIGTVSAMPARKVRVSDWQQWAPYAAVAWSLGYGVIGIAWALGAPGFPFASSAIPNLLGSILSRLGTEAAWAVIVLAGIPAAALGVAMLRNVRGALRRLFIICGALLSALLLLAMPDLTLLETLGYVPFTIFRFVTGGDTSFFLRALAGSTVAHQLFCLLGGFLWLAATVSYARRSSNACLSCGRTDEAQDWQSPERAARWGRIAVYVAMVAPLLYSLIRIIWALGIPLGEDEAYFRRLQAQGIYVGGLFLALFGLVGAALMLGLIQKWGEVFPRWMIGLGGRRVPIALAVVPAALVSVVLFVGGVAIGLDLPEMVANLAATGVAGGTLVWYLAVQVGPTLLFPVWGVALAVATLGYYFRRRGACKVCGRG